MNRQPFIVGPTADKILGFLAAFFVPVVGLIGTIVVMFVWADRDPIPEVAKRRKHAISVSVWSGVGAALPWIFALLLILLSLNSGYHNSPYGTPATFIPMGSPAPA